MKNYANKSSSGWSEIKQHETDGVIGVSGGAGSEQDCAPANITAKELENLCASFIHREDTLLIVNQLNQLIKCVQKHRGMSMTMLANGGVEFRSEFRKLQLQLERRLAAMEAFAKKMNGVLTEKDEENLHLAWVTIRQDWQDDNLNDNFELHSHFIHQLLAMVFGLAKQLEIPLVDSIDVSESLLGLDRDESSFEQPRAFKQIEILNFVTKQLPELIERIAKIRGLASHAAAVGSASEFDSRKLRYLVASTREEKIRVIAQAERLESMLLQDMPSLRAIKNIELKHIFLLNVVESDVLSDSVIVADAHQLFGLATEIIDAYWSVVDDGLDVIRRWHSEDLDQWCRLG